MLNKLSSAAPACASREMAVIAKHVEISFGRERVLSGIDLALEKGRIHGIVGRNGSGKTVLMKCLLGFLHPQRGTIQVFGKTIGRDCDFAPRTGMLIETPGFLPHETGRANLRWLARLSQKATPQQVDAAIRLVGLDPQLKKAVCKYSLGMRQRLGIAQALMENPDLLILDEVMNGLDQEGVADVRRLLLSLREQGKTLLISSHYAQDIDLLCDAVYEMQRGSIWMHRG